MIVNVKRTVTGEAIQWTGENREEVERFLSLFGGKADYHANKKAFYVYLDNIQYEWILPGDWLVHHDNSSGIKAVSDGWFRSSYEVVEQ